MVLSKLEVEAHVVTLYQLFLLLCVHIEVGVALLKPRMIQRLNSRKSLVWVRLQKFPNEVLDILR